MDVNTALIAGNIGLLREDDMNVGGTTALGVGDGGSLRRALSGMLAGGAVWHVIMELETAVELDSNLEARDREVVDVGVRAAAEGGSLLHAVTALGGDALTTSEAALAHITSLVVVSAGPAIEIETEVVVERTRVQVGPVPAANLIIDTDVVMVARAGEGGGIMETTTPSAMTELYSNVSRVIEHSSPDLLTVAATEPMLAAVARRAIVFFILGECLRQ
jgi:hypothetical protein